MNQAGLSGVITFNTKYYLEDEVVLKSSFLFKAILFCAYFLNSKPITRQQYTESF